MSDPLTNKGVAVTGSPSDSTSKAVVVVGVARGGTSMVAGSMMHLGVFMGDRANPPVFEDMRLSTAFEQKDWEAAKAVAAAYSGSHAVWGWKRPWSVDHLDDVHRVLDAPRYIFVYKDVMSIAQRNTISMLSDLLPGMDKAMQQYAKTLAFLRARPVRAMLVSYEKAMADPAHFVRELARFCGVEPREEQLDAAQAFIQPNPEHYLDVSRITKAQGRLGGIANGKMYGWARMLHSKKPASVDLFVNGDKVGTVVADQPRPDLMQRFNQACAYSFQLPPELVLQSGDVLRARVVNEVRDLENSPWQHP
ncbi:sulfotransferase [Ramlibacter sp. PS3R-8]|uniref:sulfotransferase n=1 Tax=Ramlibacter sp. PS3R-8 TaxID=3133437 RepID=UPI0030B275D8